MNVAAGKRCLRRARPGDAVALTAIAIEAKAWWGYTEDFMVACRAELTVTSQDLESAGLHYQLAVVDGTIAGFYALDLRSPPAAELEALFVQPRWIGHGLGRELLQHAIGFARDAGVPCLEIQSDPNAEGFYTRLGAVRVGERTSASIPGRVLPLLELDVATAAVAGARGADPG